MTDINKRIAAVQYRITCARAELEGLMDGRDGKPCAEMDEYERNLRYRVGFEWATLMLKREPVHAE